MRKLVGLFVAGSCGVLFFACSGGKADNSNVITIPNDLGWTPPPEMPPPGAAGMSGAAGAAGAAGTAGATGDAGVGGPDPRTDVNLVWPSSGCGMPLPANQEPTVPGSRDGYTLFQVMTYGESLQPEPDPTKETLRDIYVRVPFDYNPNTPYRVVYLGQGCGGGSGSQSTYPLFNEEMGGTEQAIYVGISLPANQPNGPCYDNRAGEASQEWEAFDKFHTLIESTYCVDNNRVFVGGYSTGGWLANMWGCYFAGIPDPPRKFAPNFRIRGQAATTGNQPVNNPTCNGPVAGLWLHDAGDTVNTIAGNYAGRDRVLLMNDCVSSAMEPWGEGNLADVCERYIDCPAEYPVIFCTTTGQGHSDQPANTIPAYTQFFDLMAPMP